MQAENDYRGTKELLRVLASGVEELLARPGHCSVTVNSGIPGIPGIPGNVRRVWMPGYQGEQVVQLFWSQSDPATVPMLRMTLEAGSLVLTLELNGSYRVWQQRVYFDGPDLIGLNT